MEHGVVGRQRASRLALGVAATLAAGAWLTGVASPAGAEPAWCLPSGPLDATDLPSTVAPDVCSLVGRYVRSGDLQVQVPSEGSNGVFATSALSGAVTSLVVSVLPDGSVGINPPTSTQASLNPVVDADLYTAPLGGSDDNANGAALDVPDASLTAASVSGSPNKCTDHAVAYNAGYPRWAIIPTWYYNTAGQPTNYPSSSFVSSTGAASTNMSRGDNSCGFAADPKIYARYGGGTTTATQITVSSNNTVCGTQDTRSVVGWGALGNGYIGATCAHWDASYRFTAADIKIANTVAWSVGSLSGCLNRWDHESVVTHEFGHWFGLQHVAEATHGNLVMSPQINGTCQANERNLGYGDLYGMLALYGKN